MYSNLGERDVRLMVLCPGAASDPLICYMKTVALNKSLDFEALSYEWKESRGSTDITCGQTKVNITQNLAAALRAFRVPGKPLLLWVDAICINQGDPEEKSKQIPLMGEIYASAKLVHVWLGPSFRGVKRAFKIIPYLAMIGVERHPTGRPDTGNIKDILARNIKERPKHGSIIQTTEDMCLFSHHRDSVITQVIRRNPNLSDDAIFRFGDDTSWSAIDFIFGSSYFQRSWIIQEVAVAEMVSIACGRHRMHWDIFRMAYEGRKRLLFQPQRTRSYIPCVQDARLRFRDCERTVGYDLGIVLNSFAYSKEQNPRDKIYAALGIVRPQSLRKDIIADYNKSVEEVFYEASCHIICTRQDLYLWSSKILLSRRKLQSIPTWVPEWTMQPCEEALEFASPDFSQCLRANPSIRDDELFVDGCLVDVVDEIFPIKDAKEVLNLVSSLDTWLNKRAQHMFGAYSGALVEINPGTLRDGKAEARELLSKFNSLPPLVMEAIRDVRDYKGNNLDAGLLNIEAIWSTLTAPFQRLVTKSRLMGHHLFLAMLYISSKLLQQSGNIGGKFPKSFRSWITAATILCCIPENTAVFQNVFYSHLDCLHSEGRIEDCFFVTSNGYFGRAPAEAVKQGQFVAVLGGAYVPYLLNKLQDHYQLVSHTYMEGIMTLKDIPAGWRVERIVIR